MAAVAGGAFGGGAGTADVAPKTVALESQMACLSGTGTPVLDLDGGAKGCLDFLELVRFDMLDLRWRDGVPMSWGCILDMNALAPCVL